MSYIGNQPTSVAFVTDQFSGNGSTVAFTTSVAPANTASVLVSVSGVLQDPTTYSVSGLTLTFSAAPPSGTGNISCRYLGIPASGVTTTAYRTVTEFTATAGQTTFTPASYTVGFIDVYRNGTRLGAADFTATNGTTVVLATGASSGDLVTTESFLVSSVVNAIPATTGAVISSYLLDGSVTAAKMAASGAWAPTGTVLQVQSTTLTTTFSTNSGSYTDVTGLSVSITPKFVTSKILVLLNASIAGWGSSGNGLQLVRGSTPICIPTGTSGQQISSLGDSYVGGSDRVVSQALSFLDSPATISATTYKAQAIGGSGGGGANYVYVNRDAVDTGSTAHTRSTSTITVMEIAV